MYKTKKRFSFKKKKKKTNKKIKILNQDEIKKIKKNIKLKKPSN